MVFESQFLERNYSHLYAFLFVMACNHGRCVHDVLSKYYLTDFQAVYIVRVCPKTISSSNTNYSLLRMELTARWTKHWKLCMILWSLIAQISHVLSLPCVRQRYLLRGWRRRWDTHQACLRWTQTPKTG